MLQIPTCKACLRRCIARTVAGLPPKAGGFPHRGKQLHRADSTQLGTSIGLFGPFDVRNVRTAVCTRSCIAYAEWCNGLPALTASCMSSTWAGDPDAGTEIILCIKYSVFLHDEAVKHNGIDNPGLCGPVPWSALPRSAIVNGTIPCALPHATMVR